MKNRRDEILNAVKNTVASWRRQHGKEICSDVQVVGSMAYYTFQPKSSMGCTVEVDLSTGESHHKGKGAGSFWTDWEETY